MGDIFGGGTNQPSGWSQPATWNYSTGGASPVGAATYNAPSWTSGLGNTIGKLAIPAAMMASGYFQGNRAQRNMQQTAQQNQQTWQQNAFPRPEAIAAQSAENRGQAAQDRFGATKAYFNDLAARGWNSGSGIGAAGVSNINKGYLQSLGQNATAMTKLKNTPMFGMPSQAYQSPVSGGTEQALQGLDYALGQLQAQQLLRQLMGG